MNLKIESMAIGKLTPDPENARKHSEANIAAIVESLSQFGQRKPIVISSDNRVIAGNGTLEAAKALGWKTIDTVVAPPDWSEAQLKAFALADNRVAELAEWDTSRLMEQAGELMGEGFALEAFGFTDVDLGVFNVEEVEAPKLEAGGKGDFEQITFTLHTSQAEVVRQAIANAKLNEDISSGVNDNSNANALAMICEWFDNGRV
jgi:hypothetical protein